MSLKEVHKVRVNTGGVKRSSSFGGMDKHGSLHDPLRGDDVLGASLRSPGKKHPRTQTMGSINYKKLPHMPKVPRPGRTNVMFHAVRAGLREFIEATQQDIDDLQAEDEDNESVASGSSSQARLHECRKQLKSAERYKKRLEFQLAKVEELHDCYNVQSQLRDGVRTMAKAYSQSPGKQKDSLHSVRCGYKECTQTMCAIEAQLENMMGTFQCKMKGMVGFARMCPGDVFEVTIRHGAQKWKTKGKVEKSGGQHWEHHTHALKALLGNIITIKAVESRSLRSVLLGEKSCETKDLFSSHPQVMTVNVNTAGTLKLSLIINWHPLDGSEEKVSYYEPPLRVQPSRRAVSMFIDSTQSISDTSNVPSRESSFNKTRPYSFHLGLDYCESDTLRLHDIHSKSTEELTLPRETSTKQYAVSHMKHSSSAEGLYTHLSGGLRSDFSASSSRNFGGYGLTKEKLFEMRMMGDSSRIVEDIQLDVTSMEEAFNNLKATLEDYQGQYHELQKLEEQIRILEELLQQSIDVMEDTVPIVSDATLSRSIKTVTEAFDFLSTEDEEGEEELHSHSYSATPKSDGLDQLVQSPESTAKTADSGIESLANQLSEDGRTGSSIGSSPEAMSSGNEQIDQALLHHLCYCDRLMENLGTFGPLKCGEIYALDKLQKQADIIERLIKIAKDGPFVTNIHKVMSELTSDKSLKEFWVKCIDGSSLCVNTERFLAQLEREFGDYIRERYDTGATKVLRTVLARFLDVISFNPETAGSHAEITLYQFMGHFQSNSQDLGEFVDDIASELWLCNRLQSGNTDIVIKTLLTFRRTLPPKQCLELIPLLLISECKDIRLSAMTYLNELNTEPEVRDKTIVVFVEALEEPNADIRCGACIALGLVKASESVDQLVFVCQTDNSTIVREKAKEAVLSLGDEGRNAYEQAALGTHGFQGLAVHK